MANRSDNFDRADTSAGIGSPSDGGSAWQSLPSQGSAAWGIFTNRATLYAGNGVAVLEASSADVEVQVTLHTLGSNNDVVARVADNDNYILLRAATGYYCQLFRCVAGTLTLLQDSMGGAPAGGDVVKLYCSGNTIRAYRNGSQVGTDVTESFGNSNTKHGLRESASGTYFDTFSITDLAGAPAVGLAAPRRGRRSLGHFLTR